MDTTPVTYLDWARAVIDTAPESIGGSFMPARSWAELQRDFGLEPADLALGHDAASRHRLRDLIAERFSLPPSRVLPVGSCSLANFLAFSAALALSGERREVLFETPAYIPMRQQVQAAGGLVRSVSVLDGARYVPERMIEAMSERTALVALTNLHNPSGKALTDEAVAALCAKAEETGAYLHVDEVYRDFIPGAKPAALQSPRAISVESLSKVHGLAELRVGWILGSEELIAKAAQINDHLGVSMPAICELIAAKALQRWDAILEEARAFADARARQVQDFFDGRDDVEWRAPDGGVHGLMVPRRVNPETLARAMLEEGIVITPGSYFECPEALRLGFAAPRLAANLAVLGRKLDALGADAQGGA